MMPIDVQQSANSLRIWLEIRMVLPIRRNSFKRALTSSRARGSRPLEGSSRIRTGGSCTRVLARHKRCFMPRDRPLTKSSLLVGQIQQGQNVVDHLLAPHAGNLVRHREEIQEFPDLHPVVHAEIVGHIAHAAPHVQRLLADAKAVDRAIARRGLEQRGQKTDRRALAGAVGPDEAKQLARRDLEIQALDGGEVVVLFVKIG